MQTHRLGASPVAIRLLRERGPFCRSAPLRVGRRRQALPEVVETVGSALLQPHPGWSAGLAANSVVYVAGIRVLLNGLTWAGVLHSWCLGSAVYAAFGLGGYFLVCLYFLIGSRVTKVKLKEKLAAGIAEERSGRRSVGNVWGSGFAGMACALLALTTGNYAFYQIGFVASFGSKLSDTVSTEIGKAYGKTTVLVTTLKSCPRGTDGAISAEGTAAGVFTAMSYAFLAASLSQVSTEGAWIVFAACVVSNFVESLIGATVQGKSKWLTNDAVNIVQITTASLLAISAQQLCV